MPQDNGTRVALTAFEVVLLGRMRSLSFRVGPADLQAAEAAMAEIGVADLAHRRIGLLSGGQRQMVLLAQVLAGNPACCFSVSRRAPSTSRTSSMCSTCFGPPPARAA